MLAHQTGFSGTVSSHQQNNNLPVYLLDFPQPDSAQTLHQQECVSKAGSCQLLQQLLQLCHVKYQFRCAAELSAHVQPDGGCVGG